MDKQVTQEIRIALSQGKFALVSPEDYARVTAFKWCLNHAHGKDYAKRGYYFAGKQSTIKMHRFIMDAPPNSEVDHVNGNGLDNRRENLRICDHKQSSANQSTPKNNKTGFKGVCPVGTGWSANIADDYLGVYDTAETAAKAYDTRARAIYGEYAKCNFPDSTDQVAPRKGGAHRHSTSGIKGVSYRKLKQDWSARIAVNGERILVGYYKSPEAAGAAIQAKMQYLSKPRHTKELLNEVSTL